MLCALNSFTHFLSHLISLCQLRKRYEYPNSRNKWDYPLFHVVSGDKEGEDGGDGTVFTALHSAANDSTSTGTDKEPTEEPVKKKSSWKPKKSTKSKAPETLETPLTTGEVSSSTTTAAPSVMRDGETLSFSGTFVNSLKDVHKVNKTSTTVLKATAQEGSADNSSSNVNSHNKKIPDTNIVWGLNLTPDEEKKQVQLIINYLVSKNQTCGNSSINDHMNKDTTTKNKSGSTANTNNADVILPNASTVSVPHMQANILYEINRVSTLITDKIIAHMKTHAAGPALSNTPISALYFEEYDCTFHFYSKLIPTTDLYRLKRQFVKINTIYPPIMNTDANSSQSLTNAVIVKTLGSSYIEFLTSQI